MSDIDLYRAISNVSSSSSLNTASQQDTVTMRMRALTRVNPYMAQRPDALYSLATSPLTNDELMDHGAAMFGMQASSSMKSMLEAMSPAGARATWSALTPGQQMSLSQQGYQAPERDEGSLIGTLFAPVGVVGHAAMNVVGTAADVLHVPEVLDAMMWLSDQPAHLYRAIRTMDDGSQWAALAGAALGVGALIAAPFTAGGSLAAAGLIGGGTLATIGTVGGAALLGGTLAAAATNPTDWYHAWMDSRNGERTFDRAAQQKADSILGDPRLVNLAHDVAVALPQDFSLTNLARQMAGNRDVSVQSQVSRLEDVASRMAERGTAEFQKVMTGLVQLIQLPQFQEAVNTLQRGKISIGRDVADNLGFVPGMGTGGTFYNLVSGGVDGVLQFALDPLLIAGRVGQATQFLRRGMPVMEGQQAVERFFKIYRENDGVQEMHKAIAAAVEAGDYNQMRVLAPTMKERWRDLLSHRDMLVRTSQLNGRAYNVDDFHNWLVGIMDMKPLMEGFGTIRGLNNGVILSEIGRKNEAWRAVAGRVRSFTDGLTDPKFEKNLMQMVEEGGDNAVRAMLPETAFPAVAKHAAAGEINSTVKKIGEVQDDFYKLPYSQQSAFEEAAASMGVSPFEAFSPGYDEAVTRVGDLTGGRAALQLTAEDVTPELLQRFALANEQYAWSRLVGRKVGTYVPGASSVGELLTKMTTMVPPGRVLHLDGYEAPEDIRALTELGSLTGMPKWLREEWGNMILHQPTVGVRLTTMQSFVDAMLTSAGIRSMPEGMELADKYLHHIYQSYAAGGLDSLNVAGRVSKRAIYLDEMADMVPMPNLDELRKAVQGGIIAKAIGIADLPVIEQFQTKVWKPSVLLRFGFIPRAAGEEFLNYMLRGGFGSLGQELGARSLARAQRYEHLKMMESITGKTPHALSDVQLLAEGPMPSGTRWVSHMLARYGWGHPVNHVLERYAGFYRGLLDTGLGQEERVTKALSGIAGADFPMYQLADNVTEYNRTVAGLDATGRVRWNLAMMADSIVLGNPHSWRRMAAGGVHDDLVEAAYEFLGHNGTSVMRAVGASNAGPFDPGRSRQDHIRIRIEDDVNGSPQFADFLTVKGERMVRLSGDPYWANATHHQMQRVVADEMQRTVFAPLVARIKHPEVPTEVLPELLRSFHSVKGPVTEAILHEFLLAPNWDRWQAALARIERISPGLGQHLARTVTRENLSFDRVATSVFDYAVKDPGAVNVLADGVSMQLTKAKDFIAKLDAMPPGAREWTASYLAHSDQSWADSLQDLIDNPTGFRPAPQDVWYRGVSSPEQIEVLIGPDGQPILRIHGQNQNHWNNGKAISFTTNYDQTKSYTMHTSQEDMAEFQLVVMVDRNAVTQRLGFGDARRLPDDLMDGAWPGSEAYTAAPGPYMIGVNGEVNLKLGMPVEYKGEYTDGLLDAMLAQWDRNADSVTSGAISRRNTPKLWTRDDIRSEIEAMKQLPVDVRGDAFRELIDRQIEIDRVSGALVSANGSDAELLRTWRTAIEDNRGVLQGSMQDQPYIDLLPGEWRIESPFSDVDLGAKRDELVEQANAVRDQLDYSPDYLDQEDRAQLQYELHDLQGQLDDIDARMAGGEVYAPGPIDPDQLTRTGQYYAQFRDQIDALDDDRLLDAILGADDLPVSDAGFAYTYAKQHPVLPGLDQQYHVNTGETTVFRRDTHRSFGLSTGRSYLRPGALGSPEAVVAPTHFAFDPNMALVNEWATRNNLSIPDAIADLADRQTARILHMNVTDLYSHPELADLSDTKMIEDLVGDWHDYTPGSLPPEEIIRELRASIFRSADVELHHAISGPGAFAWGDQGRQYHRFATPWERVDQMRPFALQGRNWGTMSKPSPLFDSWDDMSKAAHTELANAMHDPYYASRLGHFQGVQSGLADDIGRLSEPSALHDNMVTLWKARIGTSSTGLPPTFDELLANAVDRNVLLSHRGEVEAALAAGYEEFPLFANRRVAEAVDQAAARFSKMDSTGIMAVDMPRPVMNPKGLGGVRPAYGDTEHPLVWMADGDAWRSNALGHVRAPDQNLDDSVEELARRMVERGRQVFTRGNKESFVPKVRKLDDGTEQTVVQALDMNNVPYHLEPGTKIQTREQFYDHNGDAIEFGDERYFDRVMDNGDGEVLWEAVAPILMDGRDEVVGRALFANKAVIPEVGEKVPDERELVRIYRSRVEDVHKVAADVPNMVDSEVLATYKRGKWDDFVRKGFDEVIGPSIDALARRPMAFHFFAERYTQNKALRQWLRDPHLVNRVGDIVIRLAQDAAVDGRELSQVAGYARTIGEYSVDGGSAAAKWTDHQALGWLRGHTDDEVRTLIEASRTNVEMQLRQGLLDEQWGQTLLQRLDKAAARNVTEMRTTLPADLPSDDFLAYVRSQVTKDTLLDPHFFDINGPLIAQHPVLSKLSDEEWQVVQRAERNWQAVSREASEAAAVAAINDMLPFIDSHEFKTQFADYGKGFLPFWYAEENFMKRWARTLILEGPSVIQKAQLTYMGLKTSGVVRTDPNGRDWFVYPGSNLLQEAVNQIPGMPDLPVGVMFQSPTDMMLPGINSRFGVPQFGPLVSVPMDLLTVPFPELKKVERDLLGDVSSSKSALEQLVPAVVANTFNAITSDDGDQRYASAQLAAIAQLQAEGKGLPDNATPGQIDEFLRTVRNHARIIVMSQAIGGWFAPGPLTQVTTGENADVFSSIGLDDPSQSLNSMYQTLIRDLGIEQGTIEYLKLVPLTDIGEMFDTVRNEDGTVTYFNQQNPLAYTVSKQASVSGAPLPATEQALAFFDDNSNYMAEFPNAGPWLLPIDVNARTAHSQYAYDQQTISGLRRRRPPDEFLTQIKFKEASTRYFDMRTQYQDEVEAARTANNVARVQQLNAAWDQWSATYKAAHPVFADQLEGSQARQRRKAVIAEMRTIVRDPNAPQPPHFPVLQQVVKDFDLYLTRKQSLALDTSAHGRKQLEKLKADWEGYMNQVVLTNPAVQSFWTGVLRPESELE